MLALLPLPTTGDRPPSVELFVEHLGRADPSSPVSADDPAVRDLCARLDGLPLALELAAGRAAVLGVDALAGGGPEDLDLLVVPGGGGEARPDDVGEPADHGRDVEEAAARLSRAADRAWAVGASFMWGIASTVLAGVLVRHRPLAEARTHLPTLIDRWRATATWPQLWTTLRLVAELLATHGREEVAALVLAAAERDPAAPELAGDDRARHDALRARLADRLGAAAADGIAAGAAAVDRVDVLERATRALASLPGG